MREANKLVVEQGIFPQTTNRNCHTAFEVAVNLCLRTVVFFKVVDKLLWSVRQFQFLRNASKFLPSVQDFFLRRLLVERNEYSSGVTIRNRNTQALCGDERCFGGNDLVAFYLAPNLQRFFFGLFFFAADERDDIVNHFRPSLEGLACSGNCLIGASQNLLDAILPQRRECRT